MKPLLAAAVAVLVVLTTITVFGDNLRALFGMSADSLAGDTALVRRSAGQRKVRLVPAPNFQAVAPALATDTREDARSTFAIDVDTASYSWGRRVLRQGNLPDPASVRVEEWVNAFPSALPGPRDAPFAVHAEAATSPWDEAKTLLRVTVKGREVSEATRKPTHLVFLVDVSGSMDEPTRLPLVRQGLATLTRHLRPQDTVALVTYAGEVRVALEPTSAREQARILSAIDGLRPGGGTAMGSGLEHAYRLARAQVRPGHTSRVVVLTDGDTNLGPHLTPDQMLGAVREEVKAGVLLTVVGFGDDDYRGAALEQLADSGNGQALYVASEGEAEALFSERLAGLLETIARDVKVQVTFDPTVVSSYRLLGYENRAVADTDFRNDAVDGGELGAGHEVTALYEVVLAGAPGPLGTVAVRGQRPDREGPFEVTTRLERALVKGSLSAATEDLRFTASVALAADALRDNPAARWPLEQVAALAASATAGRPERVEFAELVRRAAHLKVALARARGAQEQQSQTARSSDLMAFEDTGY